MIIAIDTSTEWIGLAVYDGVQVLAECIWRSKNYHTVELVPALNDLIARAQISRDQISAVAVAIGPGSFTGLRIGVAAAKGIAIALAIPLVGIPSLDVLATAQAGLRRPMIALLKVGRGRFAYARYLYKKNSWQRQGEIAVGEPKDIAATITSPVFVCGEMGAEERQILGRKWKTAKLSSASQGLRRPSVLAELAWQSLKSGRSTELTDLTPIYVHTLSNVPEV
jgi:tRNA threonylcarbamoyladenosine biosynthesis protein TsaB